MAGRSFDIVIVGAGFAGLYMLHRARGLGLSARVIEAASGVGGTWYWNRYPGARCDVESMEYSYQFSDALQQEWNWTERYAAQEEILRYANHVADRFDLRRDIQFDTRVKAAHFDDAACRWTVETDKGERLSARHAVMATGCLSTTNTPRIPGIDRFAGRVFHTGTWPQERVSFAGRRVGVIGTGSSGIQAIPEIAREAAHVSVFQRTPNYTIPAHNRPLAADEIAAVKADYAGLRARANALPSGVYAEVNPKGALDASPEERRATYEKAWNHGGTVFMAAFNDLIASHASNETAAEFVREKIRAIVKDPEVAHLLSPRNVIGCKRLCIDTDYYASYNRPNVTLVDVSQVPIEAIVPEGLTTGGKTYTFDDLVFATGFDAMTGTLNAIDIRGSGGLKLREKWKDVPHNYLGLMVAGFPNLYTVTGPGSPSVFTNMLPAIEQHVNWIAGLLAHMAQAGKTRVEATEAAERDWVTHVAEVGAVSLRSHCDSWYLGANIEGKPRVFAPYIGGVPTYAKICDDVAAKGYEGFRLN
ncbi:MAG: NAD(P)/FAD-dependent oxidoreductase [Alphaproteobacteria bacterium]|nr:NAD(P)/FAD-dependent oxidoreductase [Alphaproteobacteria bacterium]